MVASSTKKRRKASKLSNKKSWRKHIDITDVEEALDDRRLQERTGGLAEEKADNQLFFVDKKPEKEKGIKFVGTKKVNIHVPYLLHDSQVPDLHPKKLHKSNKKQKQLTEEEQEKLKNRIQQAKSVKPKIKKPNGIEDLKFEVDIWAQNETPFTDPGVLHLLQTKNILRPKPTDTVKNKPSLIPAVELPDAGQSYNPAYDDHQKLMKKAVNQAERQERLKAINENALKSDQSLSKSELRQDQIDHNRSGLFDVKEEEEEKFNPDELRKPIVNPALTLKKKNKKRMQDLRRKAEESHKIYQKLKARRAKDFEKIDEFMQEFDKNDEQTQITQEKRENYYKNVAPYKTKRIGRYKYEEPDIEVNTSDEIRGSMRLVKVTDRVLSERMHSFKKRNILAPKSKIRQKRYTLRSRWREVIPFNVKRFEFEHGMKRYNKKSTTRADYDTLY